MTEHNHNTESETTSQRQSTSSLNELNNDDRAEMPFTHHLIVLRQHLIKVSVAVLLVFISLVYFARNIYTLASQPAQQFLPEGATLIATSVTAPFMAPIKLTLFVAVFISMPYILHQIWQFIAPALYKTEKKVAIPILLSSVVLFYAGVAFAYFLVLPNVLKFMFMFSPENVVPMTDISSYLDFITKLFLVFGITFEIPIVVFILVMAGVVTVDKLEELRSYIIVGCFAISAVVTPPDGLSMILLAIPMWLLFELGIIFAKPYKNRIEEQQLRKES